MLFYILLMMIVTLIMITFKKIGIENFGMWMTGIILVVIVGFRDLSIGNDTRTYVDLFNYISQISFCDIKFLSNRFEKGYLYFNKILSLISKDSRFLLIVTGVIFVSVFWCFIKKYSKDKLLSILLFIFLGYFGQMMNIIRIMFAVCFVLISYRYILEQKLSKFLLCILIGFCFHKTIIVFLPAYFLSKLKINYKNILLLMVIFIYIYIFFNQSLAFISNTLNYYGDYSGGVYRNGRIRIFSIFIWGVYSFITMITYNLIKRKKLLRNSILSVKKIGDKNLILMFWLSFVSTLITFLSFKFNLLNKCANYYSVFNICFIPLLIESRKKNKFVLKILVIVFFLIYFLAIQMLRPNWNHIIPYKFLF